MCLEWLYFTFGLLTGLGINWAASYRLIRALKELKEAIENASSSKD